jgi:type I restriction enzyme S subunit
MSGEKKKKLPEGWKWEKLENIFELKYGSGLPKDLRKKGIFPVFGSNGIVGYNSESITNGSTIIIGRKGSAGEVVWSDVACWPIDTTYYIEDLKKKGNLKYIYHALRFLKLSELDKSSAVPGLNRDDVYGINIPLPPTPADQIAIASDLERRMAHVEKMRAAALRQKKAIAAMQGAILREVFPYETGDELPEGWKWKTIKDVIEKNIQVFNHENYDNEKFIYIDISSVDNVSKKILNTNQVLAKDAPSRAKSILKENDIIISTVRPNLNAVALVDKSREGNICSSGFCVIRLKNGYHAPYFFYYLTSPYFVEAVSNMVQGAMYPAISNDDVKDFSIPLPPSLSDQITIAAELERKIAELEKARQTAQRQVEAIEALAGAILRKVFDFEEENTGS